MASAKEGSKGFVKRVTSTFSIRKKKNTTNDPKLLLPRSKSTGSSNYESMRHNHQQGRKVIPDVRTKSAGVSPQRRREKIDESRNMKTRCFDDSDSIWISSECVSPTSLLEERRLSVSFHFSVDEKIISWLSKVASSSLSLNQESSSSSKENLQQNQTSSKNMKSSLENSRKDSTLQSPEDKKVSFSVKSSSPINSTVKPSELTKTIQTSLEKNGETKTKLVVEPLFWPFEQKFDWTPEDILKHFSMSPRRKKFLGNKVAGTSPKSMRATLQTRKLDLKEGSKRKLMFNGTGPNSKPTRIPELKRTISNNSSTKNTETNQNPMRNSVKRNKSLPSRLRKSSKVSSRVVPIESPEETGDIVKEIKKTPKKLIMTRKSRTFLEDDFALMNDFSIEKAVGLCEFKGREGIDSDFNTEVFLFDD